MFPRKIYKFRNWYDDHHKDVLRNNELYLSSPGHFNDPYDCRITKDYTLLTTDEEKQSFIQYLRAKDGDYLRSQRIDVDAEMDRIKRKLDSSAELKEYQRIMDEVYYQLQDRFYGVISFCINWKNFVLWSYYANNHKGYAIGFHEELLRNSGLFGSGGKVQYKKVKPRIHPMEEDFLKRSFIETHSKSVNWRHEKEYRLTKLFYPDEPTNDDRTVSFPDEFISDVVIGCQASEQTINEIINIADRKNIDVYKLEKSNYSYNLIKKQIR